MTRQGAWQSHEVALESTRREIKAMNLVLTEFGEEEYPKAKKVLDDLLQLQEDIISAISRHSEKGAG